MVFRFKGLERGLILDEDEVVRILLVSDDRASGREKNVTFNMAIVLIISLFSVFLLVMGWYYDLVVKKLWLKTYNEIKIELKLIYLNTNASPIPDLQVHRQVRLIMLLLRIMQR